METRTGDPNSRPDAKTGHRAKGIMSMSELFAGRQAKPSHGMLTDVIVVPRTEAFMDAGRGEWKTINNDRLNPNAPQFSPQVVSTINDAGRNNQNHNQDVQSLNNRRT
jgi:hypothetical protein